MSASPSNGPPPLPPQGSIPHLGPLDVAYTTPYAAPNTGPYAQGALQQGPTPQENADRPKVTLNARDLSATADVKNGANWAERRNLTKTSISQFANDSGRIERHGSRPYLNRLDSQENIIPQPQRSKTWHGKGTLEILLI